MADHLNLLKHTALKKFHRLPEEKKPCQTKASPVPHGKKKTPSQEKKEVHHKVPALKVKVEKVKSNKVVVEKAKRIEDEEIEDFEPVRGRGARPAVVVEKKRPTLRWKNDPALRGAGAGGGGGMQQLRDTNGQWIILGIGLVLAYLGFKYL